jgi:hypothetical protein
MIEDVRPFPHVENKSELMCKNRPTGAAP